MPKLPTNAMTMQRRCKSSVRWPLRGTRPRSNGQGASPQDYAVASGLRESRSLVRGNSLFSLGNRELFRATRG
jgi:hypothetical protein